MVINTIYGDIASRFFEIGNTILANNITARARANIWLASRTMNGLQCITDGFYYQPSFVFAFKEKEKEKKILPGLETLSDLTKLKNHRLINQVSLGNQDWNPLFSIDPKEEMPEDYLFGIDHTDQLAKRIDSFATKHINDFLGHYGLTLPYEVEHKIENTAYAVMYIKKAHNISSRVFQSFLKSFNGSRTKNLAIVDYNLKFRGVGKEESDKIQNISNVVNLITLLDSVNMALDNLYPYKIVLALLVEGLSINSKTLITYHNLGLYFLTGGFDTSITPHYLKITNLKEVKTRMSKCSDHLNSLEKRKKDPTAALILPGYKITTYSPFKFTNTDLPCYDLKHFKSNKSKTNIEDCAPDFLEKDPAVVLNARIERHIKEIADRQKKDNAL